MPEILNVEGLDGTVFVCDNLSLLRSLDSESVDLVCIDPPFGKTQTFEGKIVPPLSDEERRGERQLMESWGAFDAASAYELGLEYPDQSGISAKFEDIWSFGTRVGEGWMDQLASVCPGAHALITATRITHSDSIAAYIAFIVERVLEIRRILKPTGSLYLHCDHEANAYLRQMLDAVFGKDCFRNEIVWSYRTGGVSTRRWPRKHDTILYYAKSDKSVHNAPKERIYYDKPFFTTEVDESGRHYADVYIRDVWDDIKPLINTSAERTGYPTQKPQELATRIIEASSNPGDMVLDCFAGCAYVPVAAQLTGRRWMACDMSPRAWTVVRRQFHKLPDLGVVTEGDIAGDADDRGKVEPRFEYRGRVIRVRGPGDLPARTTPDDPRPVAAGPLPVPTYKATPLETGEQVWNAFVERYGTSCWYCGTEKTRDRRELQLVHIEPNRRDGTNNDRWNRALACIACNSDKSNRLTAAQTMRAALDASRIPSEARLQEVMRTFEERQTWARISFEEVKAGRRRERG